MQLIASVCNMHVVLVYCIHFGWWAHSHIVGITHIKHMRAYALIHVYGSCTCMFAWALIVCCALVVSILHRCLLQSGTADWVGFSCCLYGTQGSRQLTMQHMPIEVVLQLWDCLCMTHVYAFMVGNAYTWHCEYVGSCQSQLPSSLPPALLCRGSMVGESAIG